MGEIGRPSRARLPGGGPWRIAPECPGLFHFTQRATETGPVSGRCICPRGQELSRRRQRSSYLPTRAAVMERKLRDRMLKEHPEAFWKRGTVPEKLPSYVTNTLGGRVPDLRDGACRSVKGILTLDELADKNGRTTGRVKKLKELCARCPQTTKEACRAWVLRDEQPAGDWIGVYGGMSQDDRRRLAKLGGRL
jgi:Transcription factor WhiB